MKKVAGFLLSFILCFSLTTVYLRTLDTKSQTLGTTVAAIEKVPTTEATATATPTPTLAPSPTPTPTPHPSPKPTNIPTPTPTATPTSVPPPIVTPEQIHEFIKRFAGQYGVDANVLKHIANCESDFDPKAVNSIYAGLYQFGPTTWKNNRQQMGEDPNPDLRFNAEESVQTAAYLISIGRGTIWPNCYP